MDWMLSGAVGGIAGGLESGLGRDVLAAPAVALMIGLIGVTR